MYSHLSKSRGSSQSGSLGQTELDELVSLLLEGQRDQSLLESDREGKELISRVVLIDPSLDLGEPG